MANDSQWKPFLAPSFGSMNGYSSMMTNNNGLIPPRNPSINHFSSQQSNNYISSFNNNYSSQPKRPNGLGMFGELEFGGSFQSCKIDNYSSYESNETSSPIANFPIGVFNTADMYEQNNSVNSNRNNGNFMAGGGDSSNNQGTRETGIIEKLLHSYGFIQCCDRQARLFFHFSQFGGTIEHLKIGDAVEFEMTYDKRTGKPIASIVTKIAPEVVMKEERVIGTVTSEVTPMEAQGRITYENKGECFFLPFSKDDVEGNVTLGTTDKVSFQISTNNKGNLSATHVRLENSIHPVQYQGVVCTLKDGFGSIERADVVKEIYFHEEEVKDGILLNPGDHVEFNIKMSQSKEVAYNIVKLAPGTVIFEDRSENTVTGQILKPFEKNLNSNDRNDPLSGKIKYRAPDHSENEVSFGEKDQKGDFTLRHGDWVEFRIATDRRDQLKRATSISLLDDSFAVSGERREQGVIETVSDDGNGIIQSAERDWKIPFRLCEILDVNEKYDIGSEVEFTVIQDPQSSFSTKSRTIGIRVKLLPKNTVVFERLLQAGLEGVVTKLPFINSNGCKITFNGAGPEIGEIEFKFNENTETAKFVANDCDSLNNFQIDNKVKFDLYMVKRNRTLIGKNVNVIDMPIKPVIVSVSTLNNAEKKVYQGFVAALKDGYGFIETLTLDREMFFHFKSETSQLSGLEIGTEVEYTLGTRNSSGGNHSVVAENVKVLEPGTIKINESGNEASPIINGVVKRSLRSLNPDQKEYAGLIQELSIDGTEDTPSYIFGVYGLKNKSEVLQIGDPVKFQLDSEKRAVNIVAMRDKIKATVDSIKGDQYGFLNYVVEDNRKLFFHSSQVQNKAKLQTGDLVEFVLVTNQRTGKSAAYNVSKISDGNARPERLVNRLKITKGPKVVLTRQPKNPGTNQRGFSVEYQCWRNGTA